MNNLTNILNLECISMFNHGMGTQILCMCFILFICLARSFLLTLSCLCKYITGGAHFLE